MKGNPVLLAIGVVAIVGGIVLRLVVDGSLVQIPVSVLVFGGVACLLFAMRNHQP